MVADGLITQEQLSQARDHQRITGKTLSRTLADLGHATDEAKNQLLQKRFGFEILPVTPEGVDIAALRLIPKSEATRYHLAAIRMDGDYLVVAMEEPQNVAVVDYLKTLTGRSIRPYAARYEQIMAVHGRYPIDDRRIDLTGFSLPVRWGINILFLIIYCAPLVVLGLLLSLQSPAAESFRQRITGASQFEVGLFTFLTWGTWALVVFEITGLIFKTEQESAPLE